MVTEEEFDAIKPLAVELLTGDFVTLTPSQHARYKHLCGKTGRWLDAHPGHCKGCKTFGECMATHAVKGDDAEARENLKRVGVAG